MRIMLAIFLIFSFAGVVAAGDETHIAKFQDPAPITNIKITAPDGRSATINFGGTSVTYSGDLPVDESARIFFREFPEICGSVRGKVAWEK